MISNAEQLAEFLRTAGIRPSPQRLAVYQFLATHPVHPTAETIRREVLPEIPGVSLTTIYNTLRTLSDAHLVDVVLVEDGELRFDADTSPHAHFKCTSCGAIYDLPIDALPIPKDPAFKVTQTHVIYKGTCPSCQ